MSRVVKQQQEQQQRAPAVKPNVEMTRYIICDLKFLGFLRLYEPLFQLVNETAEVSGYEMYIVEQWACDRKYNSCIMSFTGNPKHKVTTAVINLPSDSKLWNPFTQAYFDELFKAHARPKQTDQGVIYVSNLSSFPSNLNLVPVPGGNIRQVWGLFDINQNLRRTGCGGRLVLSLQMPSNASEDKFRQLFKTHENVPMDFAVRELVTLVQIGLYYCNLLAPQYVDGLLCNETLKAITMWWDRWGVPKYHVRPSSSENNFLSPRSVAAIIGFTTGVRNRISTIISSSKAPKDPFDVEFFRESLRQFQKHEHLPRSMCIDETTIESLYSQTGTKGTNSDFFGIVKSTMKEVSGKTYQGSITDVETLDIDRIRNFLQGNRARYLWLGRGERRALNLRPTINALKLGIPIESLSQSELNSSNDFKWSDIARRTIPRGKKEQPAVVTLQEAQGSKTVEQAPLEYAPYMTEDSSYMDDLSDDTKLHSHRLRNLNLKPTLGTRHLRKYMNRSPDRREGDKEAGESEEEDGYYTQGDVSDTTTDEESGPKLFDLRLEEEDVSEADADNACDVDLTSELRRRNSMDCGQLYRSCSKEGVEPPLRNVTLTNPSYKLAALRRYPSFSIFEDYFFDWTMPWAIPASVVASHYKTAMELQARVQMHTRAMDKQRSEYHVLTRRLVNRVEVDKKLAADLKDEMRALDKRDAALKAALTEVEVNAARLQYETRTLDAKMRDVEDAVETFVNKVSKLEDRVKVIACEMIRSESTKTARAAEAGAGGSEDRQKSAEFTDLCKDLATPTADQLAMLAVEEGELELPDPETWLGHIKQFIGL